MKNNKLILMAILIFAFTLNSKGQSGLSSGDPFTSLDQAANVSTEGFYFFELSGVPFYTLVDENGYVQIAIDFGNGNGNLPGSVALDTTNRGIMAIMILATLTETKEVRISTSTDSTDVTTTNDSIIYRVQNNLALHRGYVDTLINQDWVGQNAEAFTTKPTFICGPFANSMLYERIVHNCGAFDSFAWAPTQSYQRENWSDGEAPNDVRFQLWVKGTECPAPSSTTDIINSCNPITWIDGITYSASNNTASMTLTNSAGCDSIVNLDLTIDLADASATQNGYELLANSSGQTYQWLDCDNSFAPIAGETNQTFSPTDNGNYAVIVDNGNCSDTSACFTVAGLSFNESDKAEIQIFPNPVLSNLTIQSNYPLRRVIITDLSGRQLLFDEQTQNPKIDLDFLPAGIYFIQVETTAGLNTRRFVKK